LDSEAVPFSVLENSYAAPRTEMKMVSRDMKDFSPCF